MDRNARSKLNTQIYEEACEWFVECRGGDLDEAARREFDQWLRKSPEHLSAYLEIAAIWNEGPSLDPKHKWDAETLIAQAASDAGNVVPLSRVEAYPPTPRGRGRRPLAFAASIAAVTLIAAALIWSQMFRAPTYTTAVGEQRSIALADGSTIELNSRSRIRVRYSEQERAIALLEGQALFQVAKDHARPFIVTSGDTRVRAVGTQFDIYRKSSGTVVTVLEGRVAVLTENLAVDLDAIGVSPGASPSIAPPASERDRQISAASESGAGIFLSAGEQLTVAGDSVQKTARPNVASATAWTQRRLVFDSATLSEVAEEFNRYNDRRLVIQDAELYGFHISGVFSSTDPSSLIRFLRERPGVEVIETPAEIRVAKKVS